MDINKVDDIYIYHKENGGFTKLWLNKYMMTTLGETLAYILSPDVFHIAKNKHWYTFGKHDFKVIPHNRYLDSGNSSMEIPICYEQTLLTQDDLIKLIPDEVTSYVSCDGTSFCDYFIYNNSGFMEVYNRSEFYKNYPNVNLNITGNSLYNYIIDPDYKPFDILLSNYESLTPPNYYHITIPLISGNSTIYSTVYVAAIFGTYKDISTASTFDFHVSDYELDIVEDIYDVPKSRVEYEFVSYTEIDSNNHKLIGKMVYLVKVYSTYTTQPSYSENLHVVFRNKTNNNKMERRFKITYV